MTSLLVAASPIMILTPRNLVGATVRLTTQVLQPVNTSRICTVSHALDCSFVSQVVGGCCASFGIQTEPWKMSERDSNSRSLGTLEPQARICEKERNAQGFVRPVLRYVHDRIFGEIAFWYQIPLWKCGDNHGEFTGCALHQKRANYTG